MVQWRAESATNIDNDFGDEVRSLGHALSESCSMKLTGDDSVHSKDQYAMLHISVLLFNIYMNRT